MKAVVFSMCAAAAWCAADVPLSQAQTKIERPEWRQHFDKAGVKGVFVLLDADKNRLAVSDPARAAAGFVPASTFKIANAIAALDSGVVKDEREKFSWDGVKHRIEAWNRTHTLASAMRHSVVPVYQEVARRIGAERMAGYVRAFDYGNADISGGIDRFWLDGALRISAVEQVQFLRKLKSHTLAASERSQRIAEALILHEAAPAYRLHAKTGYQPPIGWWVGWVEKEEGLWFFALNIDISEEALLPQRIAIAKAILRAESIIPPE